MYPIYAFGSKEQKDRWIPKLAQRRGDRLLRPDRARLRLEPRRHAHDRARRTATRYVLNGAKAWITNGSIADVAVVWAKLDGVVRGFLVEKGTTGFSTFEHKGKMSLRASVTSQLAFEDCRIPAENILPGVEGLKGPLSCLTQARYGIAWGALGSAMATYQARARLREEPQAVHGPADRRAPARPGAAGLDDHRDHEGAAPRLQLGRMKDAGTMSPHHVSMAKRNNVWVARECAKLAREILGANGIVNEYPVFRHLANIESVYTYEGTHDIHTLVIGQAVTGIPAYNPPME